MIDDPSPHDRTVVDILLQVTSADQFDASVLQAERALLEHFRARALELIGEDERIEDAVNAKMDSRVVPVRNALKAELRERLKQV